ncbi:MAG: DEAD/DEAH box helicase, partial [Chloroflexota bacterium]
MDVPVTPKPDLELRPYQAEALLEWTRVGGQGVVVLPTGAGKTALGAVAIASSGGRALVVVPTIELVSQWRREILRILNVGPEQVQMYFPNEEHGHQLPLFTWEPPAILITTYAGASRNLDRLHYFDTLIFDEVHHLPAPTYRRIAEDSDAGYRLGLTATPERYDLAHVDLDSLIGPTVYRRSVADLPVAYLAPHELSSVLVDLEPVERHIYNTRFQEYIGYMRKHRLRGTGGYQTLIKRATRDRIARDALSAHQQAREIAL